MKSAPLVILPDPPAAPAPLGLIAGDGRLPVIVAAGMRRAGHAVHCVGLGDRFDGDLPGLCDSFHPVAPLRLGSWGRRLRAAGVKHAVMVGRVDKARIMHSWTAILRNTPDWRAIRMWYRLRRDRRSHLILAGIADEMAEYGVQLIDSTAHIPDHMATPGVMTEAQPTAGQRADADFGWPILQQMLTLDVGQAIVVRERDVIAVEAVEGTDRMIERSGTLCRSPGWVMLKGARPGHDRRSDVPTIGPDTVRNLHAAGGRCIAVAAGDVIMIDKPEMIRLADSLGVAIMGIPTA